MANALPTKDVRSPVMEGRLFGDPRVEEDRPRRCFILSRMEEDRRMGEWFVFSDRSEVKGASVGTGCTLALFMLVCWWLGREGFGWM